MTAIDIGKSSRGQTGNARFGAKCSIPIPQSELDQSKAGLIRRDRHVGHVIWIVLEQLPSGYRTVWRVVIKPVTELLEKLGEQTDSKVFKVMDKLVRENGTGTLCGPRVEIIGTKDWKSGVLAKDLLGEQETTRRNRVGLLRHNSSDTMYLPRHNCTVTGTQGVHYCGFPIAMKAWMGTSESVPSHDWLGSGSDPRKTTVRIKMRSMSSEKINYLTVTEFINFLAVTGSSYRVVTKQFGGWLLSRLLNCWRSWESRKKAARGWLERLEGGYVRLSNRPVSFNEISADQRGDIPALYGSGETRERDIPREGDSDRKDRESWPEGGPGSQLLAAGTVREGNIPNLCSAWVLVNSSSPSYRGLDDADLP
ncbi:hypothetical protein F2Q68_00015907 [Brassica cretica]|uniref:Uncharacterized protein n=1 Tax=Brassica cretica TaxID=69181 RepID=A0A8S9HAF2_BRACR|nr:hypothetical protein F2Q68_00015907 [Brassica cretica]